MDNLAKLIEFLNDLRKRKIYFSLDKIRDSILVEISLPGEKWEVEFMLEGDIQIERYTSTGGIIGEEGIQMLFDKFSE